MGRAKWKGPYVQSELLTSKILKKKQPNNLIASRNSKIIPKFIGVTFTIYNGKKYTNLTITKDMVGHKFGEFSFTRVNFELKKKKKKKL